MRVKHSFLIIQSVLEILQLTLANSECPLDTMTPGTRTGTEPNFTKLLHRKRRHLVFPKSTTFVITVIGLKSIQVKEPTNWNLDLEFDIIWPIPSDEISSEKKIIRKKSNHKLRRHKRDFYNTFELALQRLGFPGKNCILRTICESKIFLQPPGISFLDDLLRVILSHEEDEENPDLYDIAYQSMNDCHKAYQCPISLLELLVNNF
ncbi:uncharacterized protein LOC123261244 [Cotesia glomerata]|uniref:Uncharacterized protein n=1 Tax=Cotesia glomerata TaxID=32391 RepID=A0AAV7I9R6_COTGL|nr:uncharacterized protein LOC123261244 [Cotesia glomerata]KAH0549485.1 hypothetical protein KQX54_009705 [Cotesia glomerata]